MFWNEDKQEDKGYRIPDDIVDLSFAIRCKMLPLDHAYALSHALHGALPWLADEEAAGVHLIHGAESGNGWYRPQDTSGALLHLSRRTRMMLRVPKHRVDDARALEGAVLDVAGNRLEISSEGTIKLLSAMSTLFARHVVMADPHMNEAAFLEQVVADMRGLGIRVNKILCGKAHDLHTPEGVVHTQSVMIADLEPESAVLLQQKGIGPGRKMGCGLFLPHRGIKAVKETH
ncbi:MAG: type I-MYXAN CRISPR-associated protein Cas6/Cmx6 [Gammaproteobacteria bacterium]|nr:type I-MYXAN CRISPR-associated protein Cas6/Cmx6 [Gammaproteobacteria bacterium]